MRTKLLLILLMELVLTGCGNQDVQTLAKEVVAEDNFNTTESEETSDAKDTDVIMNETISAENDAEDSTTEYGSKGNLTESDKEDEAAQEPEQERIKVKGIYVTGPIAGIEEMDELTALVEETELNAMVIDIKNDEGVVTYKMQSDTVLEIEAGVRYIPDIKALIDKLHEKDIYLIARIVAFKDPYLAEHKPELSLKTASGEIFRDKNGEAWVNPYKREVWDYLVEIGTEAAQAGFDEVQFDYIRFTTDSNADKIDYGEEAVQMTKEKVITGFTEYAYEALHPLGVVVSADVFGTIIDNEYDAGLIGQNYKDMAAHLDYICPMVYPSHYINGAYDIAVPDKEPYETVYHAMIASQEKLEGMETGVRVWIQDFTATWINDHLSYGPKEVRAQIEAANAAGYEEWILWNARTNYTADALSPRWEAWKTKEAKQAGEAKQDSEEAKQGPEETEETEQAPEEVSQQGDVEEE